MNRYNSLRLICLLFLAMVTGSYSGTLSPLSLQSQTPTFVPIPDQTPTPVPLPSQTPSPLPPTSTSPAYMQRLPVPAGDDFLPSPDGSLFLEWVSSREKVILYGMDGSLKGQYYFSDGTLLCANWLPDSSGVFIWNNLSDFSVNPKPIFIMDREGQIHSIGLVGINPELSPDGKWIAATQWEPSGYDGFGWVSKSGGPALRFYGKDSRFIGWEGSKILFFAPGGIDAFSPEGWNAAQITHLSPDEEIDLPTPRPLVSPDGQVIIVLVDHNEEALANGQLNAFSNGPKGMIDLAYNNSWTGPHETVGFSSPNGEGEAVLVDMISGVIDRHTGIVFSNEAARSVSWPWMAWASLTAFEQIHFTNLENKTTVDLGKDSPDIRFAYPVSNGKFLLSTFDGTVFMVNPALIGQ